MAGWRAQAPSKTPCFFLFVTVHAYSSHDIAILDIWYHLKSDRLILENFKSPLTNTFSYIVADHPSYNFYWLFQVIIYVLCNFSKSSANPHIS